MNAFYPSLLKGKEVAKYVSAVDTSSWCHRILWSPMKSHKTLIKISAAVQAWVLLPLLYSAVTSLWSFCFLLCDLATSALIEQFCQGTAVEESHNEEQAQSKLPACEWQALVTPPSLHITWYHIPCPIITNHITVISFIHLGIISYNSHAVALPCRISSQKLNWNIGCISATCSWRNTGMPWQLYVMFSHMLSHSWS